ncbi:50S ribosomal protein L29 [Candidatus Saccharibacteria bacterium TM7i]|nr:50S ribosomal protein L29 [Candidatus Saccharibacteria bacterium TM7i]
MAKTQANTKNAAVVKTVEELHEEVVKLQEEHRETRRSHRMGELVNPRALTVQRKAIARALTALNAAKKSDSQEEK